MVSMWGGGGNRWSHLDGFVSEWRGIQVTGAIGFDPYSHVIIFLVSYLSLSLCPFIKCSPKQQKKKRNTGGIQMALENLHHITYTGLWPWVAELGRRQIKKTLPDSFAAECISVESLFLRIISTWRILDGYSAKVFCVCVGIRYFKRERTSSCLCYQFCTATDLTWAKDWHAHCGKENAGHLPMEIAAKNTDCVLLIVISVVLFFSNW